MLRTCDKGIEATFVHSQSCGSNLVSARIGTAERWIKEQGRGRNPRYQPEWVTEPSRHIRKLSIWFFRFSKHKKPSKNTKNRRNRKLRNLCPFFQKPRVTYNRD